MKCIIIHGCPSDAEKAMNPETRTYDKHWIPWTKEKLAEKGIKVETPFMPEPWYPNYEKFKAEFEKYEVDEDTVLIGHSCGCAFLVRWLGETKQKVAKLILVAPWKIPDEGDNVREAFYVYPIDKTIKDRVQKIVMFTADDEEKDGKKSLQIYHQSLGGEVIELKGHGHYTMGDMGTTEFPELLQIIFKGIVFSYNPDGTTTLAPDDVQKHSQKKQVLMEKSKENWGRLGKRRHLILYHGTNKRNLERILKEGIKPRGGKKSNWETGIGTSRDDLVYLTYCYACYYAGVACKEDDDIPVVIKVRVNQNKTELFPDEEFIFKTSLQGRENMSEKEMVDFYNSINPKMSRMNPNLKEFWKNSLKYMGTVCVEYVPVHNIIGYAELSFKDKELLYEHMDPVVSPENYYILSAFYIDYLERLNYVPLNK